MEKENKILREENRKLKRERTLPTGFHTLIYGFRNKGELYDTGTMEATLSERTNEAGRDMDAGRLYTVVQEAGQKVISLRYKRRYQEWVHLSPKKQQKLDQDLHYAELVYMAVVHFQHLLDKDNENFHEDLFEEAKDHWNDSCSHYFFTPTLKKQKQ